LRATGYEYCFTVVSSTWPSADAVLVKELTH